MSQTPEQRVDPQRAHDYVAAWKTITRWTNQGRSWSGRERHGCFLNMGVKERFANIAAVSGLDFSDDGRGLAVVDWDQDGDLDLWMTNRIGPQLRFLRNDVPSDNRFLAIRLEGRESNRDAVGARVELVVPGAAPRRHVRTLRAGEGFLSQSSKWLHFGLGRAEAVERVEVRWPSGKRESFVGLEPSGRFVLIEGAGRARRWDRGSGRKIALAPAEPAVPPNAGPLQHWLVDRYPLRPVGYRDRGGRQHVLGDPTGRPVLVLLWASWCAPCVRELKELTEARRALEAAGVDVVAFSVDDLTDRGSDLATAMRLLDRIGFPYVAAGAEETLLRELQRAHDDLFMKKTPLPIPTSLLLDRQGDLAAIYKGGIAVERLLADVRRLPLDGDASWKASLPFVGTWLHRPRDFRVPAYFARAVEAEAQGDWRRAARRFRQVTALRPQDAEPWVRLGRALRHLQDFDAAREALAAALLRDPDRTDVHYALGDLQLRAGHRSEAIAAYRHVLRIDPDAAEAHAKLGVLLATGGNPHGAEDHLRAAVRFEPNNPRYLGNLGRFLEQQGHIDEAVAATRAALALAQARKDTRLANQLARRLAHYRQGQGRPAAAGD